MQYRKTEDLEYALGLYREVEDRLRRVKSEKVKVDHLLVAYTLQSIEGFEYKEGDEAKVIEYYWDWSTSSDTLPVFLESEEFKDIIKDASECGLDDSIGVARVSAYMDMFED